MEIEDQLKKLFESLGSKFVKVSFILSELDISEISRDIAQRGSIYSIDSMIKLYIYKRVKAIMSFNALIRSLSEEDALNLGFHRDTNNNIMLPKKRTFNYFSSNHKSLINKLNLIASKVTSISLDNNIALDLNLLEKTTNNANSEFQKSQAVKETIRLIKKLVYPKINIKISKNAKVTTKDLLDILVHVAYSHDFINDGCATFKTEERKIKVPNPDTILYHFKKFDSVEDTEEIFRNVFDFIFNFAKSNYRLLNRRELDIAIDTHQIPYYGKNLYPNFTKGGIAEGVGTRKFLNFITCSIVVGGKRFAIDAIPMHPVDSLEELVEKIIKRAKSKIKIRHCYLDRGFDRTEVVKVLKRNNVKFLMPKIKSYTVKAWYDKSKDCKARVIKDFKIGQNTNVNLILVDDKKGIKRAFSTNLDIPEQLAHYLFSFYKFRWGIETSYRQIDHDFLARTTSRNFNLRLFYFLFSVCLYNLWVLVNLCVSLKIYGRLSQTPIISAKLFAVLLYKFREDYIDPGG